MQPGATRYLVTAALLGAAGPLTLAEIVRATSASRAAATTASTTRRLQQPSTTHRFAASVRKNWRPNAWRNSGRFCGTLAGGRVHTFSTNSKRS